MDKKTGTAAGILGMTAIILGAFGAHALKKTLSLEHLATFETGVRYQMYHALFLLLVSLHKDIAPKTKKLIVNLTLIGTLFFSGSIYLLATNSLFTFDFKTIGFITPIGGFLLIIAWGILTFDFFKMGKKKI